MDHKVAEAYGVWVQKSMMGKKYMGIARTTFVIDKEGVIQYSEQTPTPKELPNFDAIKAKLAELK